METLFFFLLSALAIASAVVVITHRRPVISAMALAVNLVSIAGFYLLLNAQFMALLQILVYTGAILVLILFVIMLLNLDEENRLSGWTKPLQRVVGGIAVAAFLGLVAWVFAGTDFGPLAPVGVAGFGTVKEVGTELFSTMFYPFEVISLLLVAAMVGAVLLAKRSL